MKQASANSRPLATKPAKTVKFVQLLSASNASTIFTFKMENVFNCVRDPPTKTTKLEIVCPAQLIANSVKHMMNVCSV